MGNLRTKGTSNLTKMSGNPVANGSYPVTKGSYPVANGSYPVANGSYPVGMEIERVERGKRECDLGTRESQRVMVVGSNSKMEAMSCPCGNMTS